jgi:hypothetical protein
MDPSDPWWLPFFAEFACLSAFTLLLCLLSERDFFLFFLTKKSRGDFDAWPFSVWLAFYSAACSVQLTNTFYFASMEW